MVESKYKYKRDVQEYIESWMFQGKLIVIYGARRVGKTTLSEALLEKYSKEDAEFVASGLSFDSDDSPYKYLSCDSIKVRQALETENEEELKKYLGNSKLVVIDEAQRIENIGLILKILIDNYPEMQIVATGSSSFDLSNKINEPMTGRVIQVMLHPLALNEIKQHNNLFKIESKLENILIYGMYPEIFELPEKKARDVLDNVASNYLYKDILEFEQVKSSKTLFHLLQMLALQLGNEVSYQELGNNLNINSLTVKRYIDLLEKCFVIFSLHSFSRNYRKEISKSVKVYFYDLGIRNALIQAFNPLSIRTDTGALWENFCIVERLKYNESNRRYVNKYFWRTYDQKEIDYIEEHSGILEGYEFKWGKNDKSYQPPGVFLEKYPESTVKRIDRSNYTDFVMSK